MDNRGQWSRRVYFYQLRSQLGEDPFEILTRLTHRVWVALEKNGGRRSLGPPCVARPFPNVPRHFPQPSFV
jgi:hypothetical protein